jgi:acetyltransferase-like isoleucine patch superfamily enzyme
MNILLLIKRIYFLYLTPNNLAKKLGVKFGENCHFNTKNFGSEPYLIKIGNNFYTSAKVQFITHDGSINVLRNLYPENKNADIFKPIIIGNNVFIGYGSIILPGTNIEDNVIIGAGSIVKGNILANSVYAGIPAKFICTIEEYYKKNKENFILTKGMNKNEKISYINLWIQKKYPKFKEL